ncbi:MAG: hypothetical protein EPN40_13155 [Rhodanobacteraceae bacterium]|nr:MAG: hypothetical protein EPN40_13155 [Rhodanobacteraceae bacterium]
MRRHSAVMCLIAFLGVATMPPAAAQGNATDTLAVKNVEIQFHQAGSILPRKNIDLMMSLFADDAVLIDTANANTRYNGKAEVRRYFETVAAPFRPGNHWIGCTPAMRNRSDVKGNHATLYFECLWMDVDKNAIGSHSFSGMALVKVNGKWLVSGIKVDKVAGL